MTRDEVMAWLDDGPRWTRVATVGRDGYPHVVPVAYFRLGDEIIVGVRGQREVNLRRNPRVCLVMDEGTDFPSLKGAVITGDATVVDDPAEILELTRAGARARGTAEADLPTTARPGRTFARVVPKKIVSWDNSRR
jgi:nitroimidazol reductase NimA-like FMN-containing flavoprotein (pyridoxamine 5'-phosphate oxidase superfamily)